MLGLSFIKWRCLLACRLRSASDHGNRLHTVISGSSIVLGFHPRISGRSLSALSKRRLHCRWIERAHVGKFSSTSVTKSKFHPKDKGKLSQCLLRRRKVVCPPLSLYEARSSQCTACLISLHLASSGRREHRCKPRASRLPVEGEIIHVKQRCASIATIENPGFVGKPEDLRNSSETSVVREECTIYNKAAMSFIFDLVRKAPD